MTATDFGSCVVRASKSGNFGRVERCREATILLNERLSRRALEVVFTRNLAKALALNIVEKIGHMLFLDARRYPSF
jgi:hypothetical protein